MTAESTTSFPFAGRTVEVIAYRDFASTVERITTFISNFGTWDLPPSVAESLGGPRVHLEWFHMTGELVVIGAVPVSGHGSYEVAPRAAAVAEVQYALGPLGDATAGVERFQDGSVREVFAAMEVPYDTRSAILAVIEHGPRVHALLWGWHEVQHRADGWEWLEARLAEESTVTDEAWH